MADATVLFDGGDIGLNNNSKKMRSFAIIEEISAVNNVDPVITLSAGVSQLHGAGPADDHRPRGDPDGSRFDQLRRWTVAGRPGYDRLCQ